LLQTRPLRIRIWHGRIPKWDKTKKALEIAQKYCYYKSFEPKSRTTYNIRKILLKFKKRTHQRGIKFDELGPKLEQKINKL
jgi:hypothetical protein